MNINRPEKVDVNHLIRNLLADKPRIVRNEIDWEGENGKNIIKMMLQDNSCLMKEKWIKINLNLWKWEKVIITFKKIIS